MAHDPSKPIYAAHGVAHAWLVDPIARTLEVFRLESGRGSLIGTHEGDESVVAEPFEAVPLELGALWIGDDEAQADTP